MSNWWDYYACMLCAPHWHIGDTHVNHDPGDEDDGAEKLVSMAVRVLESIRESREPVTIRTPAGVFENMALVSLTADGDATFRQICIVPGRW